MKAARFHGRGDVRIDDIAEPALRPGTVKIRVEWCGICGTDLHEYLAGPIFCPTPERAHPLTGETSPVVLGHEFSGVVHEVADDIHDISIGERVTVEPRIACEKCPACLAGHRNCCRDAATIGLAGAGGGLAEFVVVPRELVFAIGDVPCDIGALVEPLAVAYHAIRQSSVEPGQVAAVFGCGPIGLLVISVLRALGVGQVIAVEPSAIRRERAVAAGADLVLDPFVSEVRASISARTAGAGVDVAFECAGAQKVLAECLEVVKAAGTVVNVAISSHTTEINLLPLILKEVRLVGTICYINDHAPAIDLLKRGALSLDPLITRRICLDDLVAQGLDVLATSRDEHVKILVHP